MSTLTQYFQPPLYWQQFEDLTSGVFKFVYNDPKPTQFGRPGQAQNGVDVYGRDGNGKLVGIQCKRMDEFDENNKPRPGGKILRKHLDNEIAGAKKFSPSLNLWVLATTAKRDAKIQRYANELDEQSRAKGSFGVQLWFWDDFVTDLNRYYDLQDWYYQNVIQVRSSDDQDRIIVDLLGEAFARPAFRTPLYQETPSDFLDALKDTQHAINTGELKDRETRRVIRKAVGGRRRITDKVVKDHLIDADKLLQKLRDSFNHALSVGEIRKSEGYLQISPRAQSDLSGLRDAAVKSINSALKAAGLQPI